MVDRRGHVVWLPCAVRDRLDRLAGTWALADIMRPTKPVRIRRSGLFANRVDVRRGPFRGVTRVCLSLVGLVLCLLGFAWLRAWAFPLALTLFMLPNLAVVYNQITLPLQLLATRLAGGMLSTARFMAMRNGNILNLAGHSISVVEACDGIGYLLPLAFLAILFPYSGGANPGFGWRCSGPRFQSRLLRTHRGWCLPDYRQC